MDGGNGQCLTRIWWRIYGGIEEGTDGRIGRNGRGEEEEIMRDARIEYRRNIKERMGSGGMNGGRLE